MENPFGTRTSSVGEVVDLVKTYAKQETVEPLRNAGRFIAFGLPGALCLGLGATMLLLALLRACQYWMHGSMSWAPYLITMAGAAAVAGLAAWRISKSTLGRTR